MNVKQFKRIGAAVDEPLPTGDEMTLALTETLANKLEIRRTLLATELGFDVTNEMVLAFLLRDIKDVVPEWQKEAETLMRNDQKINAIKLVRASTSMGLKDAKEFVEQKWEHLRPSRQLA
jgi:ribosomal protein L7/L12